MSSLLTFLGSLPENERNRKILCLKEFETAVEMASGIRKLPENHKKRKHKEHKEMPERVGGEFDPEHFNANEVTSNNPNKRLKNAFE